jgi:hypothetical protein
MGGNFFDQAVDDLEAEFFVRLLPAPETQLDADFHVVIEEFDGVVEFSLKIVRIDIRAELKLLHTPAGGLVAFVGFGFFVEELAVVDDAADGGRRVGGDFDKVELPVSGQFERGIKRHDAELLLCVVYDSDFAGADFAVSAMKRFVTLVLSEWLHSVFGSTEGKQLCDDPVQGAGLFTGASSGS